MNSLKTVAEKVKRSPQIIRKKFTSLPYDNLTQHQELREDLLHDAEPLKDGIPFYCKWLGTCQIFKAQGAGCTDACVKKIVEDTNKAKSSKAECKLQKVLVVVTSKTLKVEDMVTRVSTENGSTDIQQVIASRCTNNYHIYRVSYCTADPNFPKVFAFIARQKGTKVLQCHALLCNKESMAKAISLTVADAFSSAYESFEELNHSKMTQVLQDTKAANEPSTSKPVSLLLLSQTASTENGTCLSKNDPEDTHIEGTKNPFYDIDPQESPSNPFMQANKEGRKAM
ncbi:hypothetical protein QZH41_013715 [Actinostola sp. cb2023]|nr:hypothetical protein QZH41_013715 [Actinostola sp. cb2023]